MFQYSALFAAIAPAVLSGTLQSRQSSSNTAKVDFSANNGAPQHLAAGVLYGIPGGFDGMSPSQIPNEFYQPFNYYRFGGAQMAQGGWITGMSGYTARFQNARSDFQTGRKFGAKGIMLPHDVWGTDHANQNSYWPGDNGNWTEYDNFLNQLLSDMKSNNMIENMVFDIWNEPDGGFWDRSQQQYLDMYVRTHKRIRSDSSLNAMLISGPSSAGQPGDSWWGPWLSTVVGNKTIPDQYSWHAEPSDPQADYAALQSQTRQYGAPSRPVNINEYATFAQQCAASSVWFISRLERINANGLRGNWLSSCQLHDFLASQLVKSDMNTCGASGYSPNGDWQTYKYYTANMTGWRAGTQGSGDGQMDTFATVGNDKTVRLLVGVVNSQTGTWYVQLNNLQDLGLPASGTLNIQTYGLIDKGHNGAVSAPTTSNRGVYGHPYSGGTVTFPIYQTNEDLNTAWIFEFST